MAKPSTSEIDEAAVLRRSSRQKASTSYIESDSDEEEEEEEEYVESRPLKRKAPTSRKAGPKKNRKTAKAISRLVNATFEENYLYEALSHPETAILELALEWVEAYENDSVNAITTLVNLMLRCCGCIHLLQPHDLANLESSADTVAEVQIAYELQKSHEYPFISNNKDLKFFRRNVIDFFGEIITLAHEKSLLFKGEQNDEDEDEEDSLSSPIMTQILTWFSSFSTSTTRPLRFTSTIIILSIQTKLCEIMVSVVSNMERSQRQLENVKTNKKSKAYQKKVDTVTQAVKTYHIQMETIREYFTDILEITFSHRYRDIDPLIRQECLKQLGEWMLLYPEFFFQSSNLRYFGWLLSDPSNHVRSEASRVLLKLYRSSHGSLNMSVGFRQFTDRFKKQIIAISSKDTDFGVRLNLVSCLVELQKIGFLDDVEKLDISLQFFTILATQGKNHGSYEKIKLELAKFIALQNSDAVKRYQEKYSILLSVQDNSTGGVNEEEDENHAAVSEEHTHVRLESCFKYKSLANFIQQVKTHYLSKKRGNVVDSSAICVIYASIAQLPTFTHSWEFLVNYFLYDMSAISSKDGENAELNEVKEILELNSNEDKYYILSFIVGALTYTLQTSKLKRKDPSTIQESSESVLLKLSNFLTSIQSILMKSNQLIEVFMKLWNLLLTESPHTSENIYSTYKSLDQLEVFNNLVDTLLKYYQNYEPNVIQDPILRDFDGFLEKLLGDYNNSISRTDQANITNSVSLTNTEIRMKVQDLLLELVAEVKDSLKLTSLIDIENSVGYIECLRILTNVSRPILKLNKLGEFINVNEFLKELTFTTGSLLSKLFNGWNLDQYVREYPNKFLSDSEQFTSLFKIVLDFSLMTNSWKLEELMYVPATETGHQLYDMEIVFEDLQQIFYQITGIFVSTFKVQLNERTNISSMRILRTLNNLQTLFGAKYIDLAVSMKIFYTKYNRKDHFKNFESFFSGNNKAANYFLKKIPFEIEQRLLEIFLYKEAVLAGLVEVDLDRNDEEDVNFGDFDIDDMNDNSEVEINESRFDDDEDEDDDDDADNLSAEGSSQREYLSNSRKKANELTVQAKRQERIWQAEKDICVFTMKLFALINLSMVDEQLVKRLNLNSVALGGLFYKIIKLNEVRIGTNISKETHNSPTPIPSVEEDPRVDSQESIGNLTRIEEPEELVENSDGE